MPATPTLRQRLCALFYESILLIASLFTVLFLLQVVALAIWHTTLPTTTLQISAFLISLAYAHLGWAQGRRTLAMQVWHITIQNKTGTPLTSLQAWRRACLAWLGYACFGLSIWWAFFDRDRQLLHDHLAGTRLVVAD